MSVRPHWPFPAVSLPRPPRPFVGATHAGDPPADAIRAASRHTAVWISRIACPPVVALALLVRIVDGSSVPRAWAWAAMFALPAVVTPALVVAALVRAGRVVDFDLSDRRQRHLPFAVATLCAVVSTAVLANLGGPATLVAFGVAWSALLALLCAVTLRWKISLHGAAAGAAAGMSITAGGAMAGTGGAVGADLALWLALPLAVGWARVVLRRHTPRQVVAGTAVGVAAIVLASLPY